VARGRREPSAAASTSATSSGNKTSARSPAKKKPASPHVLDELSSEDRLLLETAQIRRLAARIAAQGRRKDRPPRGWNPFKPADPPPKVVGESVDGEKPMAMDSAFEFAGWAAPAAGSYYASAYMEGQEFLGYGVLAILAQRAEYRVITETYAAEMTREWVEFSGADQKAEDGEGEEEDILEEDALPALRPAADDAPLPWDPNSAASEREGRLEETPASELRSGEKRGTGSANRDKTEKIKELEEAIKNFGLKEVVKKALENDGFQGRGQVYVDACDADDRNELRTSIGDGRDEASKKKVEKGSIKRFAAIEPMWCYPNQYESADPLKRDWYRPETWWVMGKEVHRTRLITFVGREVPDMLKPAYSFGGLSLTQMCKPYVDNWLRNRQSASDLVNGFSVMVLLTDIGASLQPSGIGQTIGGLTGAGGDALVARAELFNAVRENLGLLILNKATEEFKNVSASLSGVADIVAQSQEHLASVSQIPLVKLFGIQPAGLNADSEGVIRVFYDRVKAMQEAFLRPLLESLFAFVQLHIWGRIDPDIKFAFKPLWQLDEAGKAAIQKTKADTRAVDLDAQIIDREDARRAALADPDSQYAKLNLSEEAPLAEELDQGELEGAEQPGAAGGSEGEGGVGAKPSRRDNAPGLTNQAARFGGATTGGFHANDRYANDGWEENKHPRDRSGKFARSGSGGGGSAEPQRTSIPSAETQKRAGADIKSYLNLVSELSRNNRFVGSLPLTESGSQFLVDEKTYAGPHGKPHQCYKNAADAAMTNPGKYTYVEGLVTVHGVPIEHAWVVDRQGRVVDPTIKDPTGISAYYGVPIKHEYLLKTLLKNKVYGMFGAGNQSIYSAPADEYVDRSVVGGSKPEQGAAEKIPPDRAPATSLFEQHEVPSVESFIASLPKEDQTYLSEMSNKLATVVPTDRIVEEGGHRLPNGKWTPERQKLHAKIIREFMSKKKVDAARPAPGTSPTFVVISGRAGSGKSWLTRPGAGPIDAERTLVIDNDSVKAMLPEYEGWNAGAVHEEASYIAEKMMDIARRLKINVTLDGTLKSLAPAQERLEQFKADGYDLDGYYMFAPPAVAARRAVDRARNTGRLVPPAYVLGSTSNERTFDGLRQYFNKWQVYDSSGEGTPKLKFYGDRSA
jgi:uncharacterized protein